MLKQFARNRADLYNFHFNHFTMTQLMSSINVINNETRILFYQNRNTYLQNKLRRKCETI